jgi:hypothetical protein
MSGVKHTVIVTWVRHGVGVTRICYSVSVAGISDSMGMSGGWHIVSVDANFVFLVGAELPTFIQWVAGSPTPTESSHEVWEVECVETVP